MFTLLIMMMVSWAYTYVKLCKFYILNMWNLLYINYTPKKLLKFNFWKMAVHNEEQISLWKYYNRVTCKALWNPGRKRLILTMDIENTSQRRWSYSASVCTFNHNNPYPKSLTYFSFSFLLPLCQFLLKTWFQVLALKLCGNWPVRQPSSNRLDNFSLSSSGNKHLLTSLNNISSFIQSEL